MIENLNLRAQEIRKSVIRSLVSAGSGHSAGSLGMADVFTALYFKILKHRPKQPWWKDRDRFILSNGHICPLWYSTLSEAGYFSKKKLLTLRNFGSALQGHPHYRSLPGVENSAGPLGQGISIAIGVALSSKRDKKKFNVYCSLGDGELDEGQVWEAFMFASKERLDNLIAFVDRNHIQIDGKTDNVMPLDPLAKKITSFGWFVQEIDGNNMKQILLAFRRAKSHKKSPSLILARTVPGKGVSFMEGKYEWHGKPPTKEQGLIALGELCESEHAILRDSCKGCKELHINCECLEGE